MHTAELTQVYKLATPGVHFQLRDPNYENPALSLLSNPKWAKVWIQLCFLQRKAQQQAVKGLISQSSNIATISFSALSQARQHSIDLPVGGLQLCWEVSQLFCHRNGCKSSNKCYTVTEGL